MRAWPCATHQMGQAISSCYRYQVIGPNFLNTHKPSFRHFCTVHHIFSASITIPGPPTPRHRPSAHPSLALITIVQYAQLSEAQSYYSLLGRIVHRAPSSLLVSSGHHYLDHYHVPFRAKRSRSLSSDREFVVCMKNSVVLRGGCTVGRIKSEKSIIGA